MFDAGDAGVATLSPAESLAPIVERLASLTRQHALTIVLGGNKSLLFNAEYLISVAGPVRLVLFYDAGQVRDIGERYAWNEFKTSTGAEVRFFMPVLNVPFRLIFAANPQREGTLRNDYTPTRNFQFRFVVGSTF